MSMTLNEWADGIAARAIHGHERMGAVLEQLCRAHASMREALKVIRDHFGHPGVPLSEAWTFARRLNAALALGEETL